MHHINSATQQRFLDHHGFHHHSIEVGAEFPIDKVIKAYKHKEYDILEDFLFEQGMRDPDDELLVESWYL